MPSLHLAFKGADLKVFVELDKFSVEKIKLIRDYLIANQTYWDVRSNEIGIVCRRSDLNLIERESHKITIINGLSEIISPFNNEVKEMILEECIKIVGTD